MQHRVVVRRRRPWFVPAASALLFAACAVGVYAGWAWWHSPTRALFRDSASELEQLREERRRLVRELRAVREELQEARGRNTFEARSCQIDAQACDAVRASVTGLEAEAADLREQLAFYRSIVDPAQARAGVRVLRLALQPGAQAQVWRYELALVQPMRRDRLATGSWDLKIEGLAGQQMQTLVLDALRVGPAVEPRFSFRTFQEIGGELKLPSGFLPSRVTVTLQVQDGKAAPGEVSESFDWARVAATQE